MSEGLCCIIVGASHGGVNLAFNLRAKGWKGEIILIDAQDALPYHRPPLSKAYFDVNKSVTDIALKPSAAYEKKNIDLLPGVRVSSINPDMQCIETTDNVKYHYDCLVLATGSKPRIPPITGVSLDHKNIHFIRFESDVRALRNHIKPDVRVTIIGGGYIGLEAAASMTKLGAKVNVLEMESRLLARVTSPQLSAYFHRLHSEHGVSIETSTRVESVEHHGNVKLVKCNDGRVFESDVVIVGAGILPNTDLAESLSLEIYNQAVLVDACMQTSMAGVYSIGDCTSFYNKYYDRQIRLESVQNAVDQSKVAASNICGEPCEYDSVPWFWSDQYDTKLQIVGLSNGYAKAIATENKDKPDAFTIWYFDDNNKFLAADCVNDTTSYVVATKLLKSETQFEPDLLSVADFNPRTLRA